MSQEREILILDQLLNKLKIYDIQLSYDASGVLQAKDTDGNSWAGKEFYRFLTEECLCFDTDGNLAWGQYVPSEILEPYKELSVQNGIIPGHPEISMREELDELEAFIQGTEMARDYGERLPEGDYERYEAAIARRAQIEAMLKEEKTEPGQKERGDAR